MRIVPYCLLLLLCSETIFEVKMKYTLNASKSKYSYEEHMAIE